MLKKLLIGLLALVAIVASIAARQGSTITVERSIDIHAPPGKIAPLLASVRQPLMMVRIMKEAPATEARMTMRPKGIITRVTWRIHGPLTVRTRLTSSFIGMDMLLGSELETGLNGLKAAAEK